MDEVPTVSESERSEARRAEGPRVAAARGRDLRAAAAWLQLGERPTAGEAAGMALISAALAIVAARGVLVGRPERSLRDDRTAVPRTSG